MSRVVYREEKILFPRVDVSLETVVGMELLRAIVMTAQKHGNMHRRYSTEGSVVFKLDNGTALLKIVVSDPRGIPWENIFWSSLVAAIIVWIFFLI